MSAVPHALLRAADRALTREVPGQRIAAFRIAFGIYMLAYLAPMAPHVSLLFSHDGVYAPYLVPDYAPGPWLAGVLYAAMIGGVLLLTMGYRTRWVAPVTLGLYLHHYFLQLAVKQSAFERMIIVFLLILCFADPGRTWGFDGRRGAGVPVFGQRLVAFQIVVLYLGAGLWKVGNPYWHDGALLHATLQGMWSTQLGFALAATNLPPEFWTAFSYAVIGVELSLAVGLTIPKTRPMAIVLGVLFHVGNCVILAIPEFLICIATYPVFIEPQTLQRWADRLLDALSVSRARADAS